MSPRSFAVVTVTLLLVGVLPAVALGGVSGGPETRTTEFLSERQTLAPQDSSVEPGEVEMRIDVAADGDARWRVTTAVSIKNGDDRAAFEELVEPVEVALGVRALGRLGPLPVRFVASHLVSFVSHR